MKLSHPVGKVVLLLGVFSAAVGLSAVSDYDVVWDSPSKDFSGSMPLGNGNIGLNVWVERSGDLVFYISKIDSWGDNARLLKVGRLRFKADPPLEVTRSFRQRLDLATGTITVAAGENEKKVELRVWADAENPAVYVTYESARPLSVTCHIELWRTKPYELPSLEVSDVMFDRSKPGNRHAPTIVEPDTLIKDLKGAIGWFHYNRKSVGPATTARIQGLSDFPREDPLLHRIFGAVVEARGGERVDEKRLLSKAGRKHRFTVIVLTEHPSSPGKWLSHVKAEAERLERIPFAERRRRHEAWWKSFWTRSWIYATGTRGKGRGDAFVVTRGYALQRFINACAGRGRYPIKFNGSIFTVPYPGRPGDADYRRWGPGYWWQNTRLPYISMCASGDFDLMGPLFRMYARDLMPLFVFRTRKYFGHEGAFIPECIYFWGDVFSETYGWTPFEKRKDKLQESRWHKWEWVSGPELVWMMLDYFEYTQDENFFRETLLPAARNLLLFFDRHYKTDEKGKLVMHPAQACETWWECTNPMPEVAGLRAVTKRLLALGEGLLPEKDRRFFRSLRRKLPPLPTRTVDGVEMLAPAEKFARKSNVENPELYAVFPFRLVSFEKKNARLGLEALKHRWDRGNSGWRQDDIFMAYLGLAEEARRNLVGRARKHDARSRFSAFWGPNYDWVPDQDHGGILLKAFQAMLLQTEGRKIFLFPAWPKDWNVSFKLHAPYRTTVEGELRGGKVTNLVVSPPERRRDVVMPEEFR